MAGDPINVPSGPTSTTGGQGSTSVGNVSGTGATTQGTPTEHAVQIDATSKFVVPAMVEVNLRFMYLDPTGEARFFPPAYEEPVKILYADGSSEMVNGDATTGAVSFEAPRAMQSFTVEFELDPVRYVVNEPLGREAKLNSLREREAAETMADPVKAMAADVAEAKKRSAEDGRDAEEQYKREGPPKPYRVFELPKKITLKNADWKVSSKHYNAAKFEFDLQTDKPKRIGSETIPVTLTLDPHWQYVKFEYFDRYYGHSDHGHKPISMLPLLIEGYESDPGQLVPPPDPPTWKTRSNWVIGEADKDTEWIQCLPWIIRRSDDGATAKPMPDANTVLRFVTDDDHRYIKAEAKDKRVFAKLNPTDNDAKPCANRLRYYDLPAVWKSRKYWCRLSDEPQDQDFFEKMVTKPTERDKPLIFSLDDIVLVNHVASSDTFVPATIGADDRAAVYFHAFARPTGGAGGRKDAKYSATGLYKPGPKKDDAVTQAKDAARKAEIARQQKAKREEAEDKQRKEEEKNARERAVAAITAEQKQKAREAAENEKREEARQDAKRRVLQNPPPEVNEPNIPYEAAKARMNRAIKQAQENLDEEAQQAIKQAGDDAVAALEKKVGDEAVAKVPRDAEAQKRIRQKGDEAAATVVLDNGQINAKVSTAESTTAAAEDAAVGFPYSHITLQSPAGSARNYIADYPHWTRLVIIQGNLYDVFDRRTEQAAPPAADNVNEPVGARAAVRWINGATADDGGVGVAPGNFAPSRPAVTHSKTRCFAETPFYAQEYAHRHYPIDDGPVSYDGAPPTDYLKFGRCDIALLRCCDLVDGNELAFNLKYFRYGFVRPFSEPPADGLNEDQYIEKLQDNVASRWNGVPGDGFNNEETWFVPDPPVSGPAPPPQVKVRWLFQSLPEARAHLRIRVIDIDRAEMTTMIGTGSLGPECYRHEPGIPLGGTTAIAGWFSTAHETGHNAGLPDEYGERSYEASYGQYGFRHNLPGDPFAGAGAGIMHWNERIYNRHLWDAAEWVRWALKPADVTFRLSRGDPKRPPSSGVYPDYKLPRHPGEPWRSYAWWPCKYVLSATLGTRGMFDGFLYLIGRDCTSVREFPAGVSGGTGGKRIDGVLVVSVRIRLRYTDDMGNVRDDTNPFMLGSSDLTYEAIREIVAKLALAVNDRFNNKFYAKGPVTFNVAGGTKTETLNCCMIRFVPRFLVENFTNEVLPETGRSDKADYETRVDDIDADSGGWQFYVLVGEDTAVLVDWHPDTVAEPRTLIAATPIDPTSLADMGTRFRSKFLNMIGIDAASMTKDRLRPLVRKLMDGTATVEQFP